MKKVNNMFDWCAICAYIVWPIIELLLLITFPRLMLSLIIAAGITLYIMIKRESITEGDQL